MEQAEKLKNSRKKHEERKTNVFVRKTLRNICIECGFLEQKQEKNIEKAKLREKTDG